jgi:hypothetical protein
MVPVLLKSHGCRLTLQQQTPTPIPYADYLTSSQLFRTYQSTIFPLRYVLFLLFFVNKE